VFNFLIHYLVFSGCLISLSKFGSDDVLNHSFSVTVSRIILKVSGGFSETWEVDIL